MKAVERGGDELDRSDDREEREKSRSVSRGDEGRGERSDGEKSEGERSVNMSEEERVQSSSFRTVKRAMVNTFLFDEQEVQIIAFIKDHPAFFSCSPVTSTMV